MFLCTNSCVIALLLISIPPVAFSQEDLSKQEVGPKNDAQLTDTTMSAPTHKAPSLWNKEEAIPVALQQNSRLKLRVTIVERVVTVADVCERIKVETGIDVSVEDSISSSKLFARLRDRSAESIMEMMAELITAQWIPVREGYRLQRTNQAKKYQREWWQLLEMERGDWKRGKAALLRQQMMRPGPTEKQLASFKDKNMVAAIRAADAGMAFWRSLPPALQETVSGFDDNSALLHRNRQFSRPVREGGIYLTQDQLPEAAQQAVVRVVKNFDSDTDTSTTKGLVIRSIGNSLYSSIVVKNGGLSDIGPSLDMPPKLVPPSIHLEQWPLTYLVTQGHIKGQIPSTWKRLVRYQLDTFWPSSVSQPYTEEEAQKWQPVRPRRVEALEAYADRFDVDCLADYHCLPTLAPTHSAPKVDREARQKPLSNEEKQLVSNVLEGQDDSWKWSKEDVLLVRNNRWYRDELLEAPLPILNQLANRVSQNGKKDRADDLVTVMDVAAQAISQLTPLQIANGMKYFTDEKQCRLTLDANMAADWASTNVQPLADVASMISSNPQTCAFYGALTQSQRQALIDGSLPISALSPLQQRELLNILPQVAASTDEDATIQLTAEQVGVMSSGMSSGSTGPTKEIFGNAKGGVPRFRLQLIVKSSQ